MIHLTVIHPCIRFFCRPRVPFRYGPTTCGPPSSAHPEGALTLLSGLGRRPLDAETDLSPDRPIDEEATTTRNRCNDSLCALESLHSQHLRSLALLIDQQS